MYSSLHATIQRARGQAAKAVGRPHNVYRLGEFANGNFIDPAQLVASNFFLKKNLNRDIKNFLHTEQRIGMFWYKLVGDMTDMKVGDVFIDAATEWVAGHSQVTFDTTEINAVALASDHTLESAIGARLNTEIKIFRSSGDSTPDGYWSQGFGVGAPIRIYNGRVVVGSNSLDSAHWIPCGLMSSGRAYGSSNFSQVPGVVKKSTWYAYVPPLPGFRFREGDAIEAKDGSKYIVLAAYYQDVGTVGSQLLLEREVAQTT